MEIIKAALWRSIDCSGRTSRIDYWRLMLCVALTGLVSIVGVGPFGLTVMLSASVNIWCLWAAVAATVRRVRDAGGDMRWTVFCLVGIALMAAGGLLLSVLSQMSGPEFGSAMVPFMFVGMIVVLAISTVPYGFLLVQIAIVTLCLALAVSLILVIYWVAKPSQAS